MALVVVPGAVDQQQINAVYNVTFCHISSCLPNLCNDSWRPPGMGIGQTFTIFWNQY